MWDQCQPSTNNNNNNNNNNNINNVRLYNKQLNCVKNEERLAQKNFGMVSAWKKKEGKTSKLEDAGSDN